MTALATGETKQPKISALFAAEDFRTLGGLYRGIAQATAGAVMIAPLDKRGHPDLRHADRSNLTPLQQADALPTDMPEFRRWCVLADKIDACDPATAVTVSFEDGYGDLPVIRQIDGPKKDGDIAKLIVSRAIGHAPRMVPNLDHLTGAPAAANDNQLPAVMPAPSSSATLRASRNGTGSTRGTIYATSAPRPSVQGVAARVRTRSRKPWPWSQAATS